MQLILKPGRAVPFGVISVAAVGGLLACVLPQRRAEPALLRASVEPPWPEPPSPEPLACSVPSRAGRLTERRLVIDLEEEVLRPERFGPRVHQRPLPSVPRELRTIRAAVEVHEDALNACYRWARRTLPALEADVAVSARFDEWGVLDALEVRADVADAEPLRACVAEVLAELAQPLFVPRKTEARLTIRFHRSGLGRPPKLARPTHAVASTEPSRGRCAGTPLDIVDGSAEPIVIDDYDERQDAAEEAARRREELRAWRAAGHRGLPPRRATAPRVKAGTASVRWSADLDRIRRQLRADLGGLRACWADAVDERAAPGGTVTLVIDVDRSGIVRDVAIDGAADPSLRTCLSGEIASIVLPSSLTNVEVRWPLRLERTPPAVDTPPARARPIEIARLAAEALARGDGDAALRHTSALIAQLPDDGMACGWHLDRLRALALVAPFGDARTDAAVGELGRWIAAHPSEAHDCLAAAGEVVEPHATRAHKDGQRSPMDREALYTLAIARYRTILAALPALPNAGRLRFYQAEALYSLSMHGQEARGCDAAPLYERVAADPSVGRRIQDDAAYAARLSNFTCRNRDRQK